ncbi:hypothetical protein NQZ68_042099 [Dissostichus eleginoides]|nr:hypothetical protein NQZ68_042099 [Dissostichus eleginoides]
MSSLPLLEPVSQSLSSSPRVTLTPPHCLSAPPGSARFGSALWTCRTSFSQPGSWFWTCRTRVPAAGPDMLGPVKMEGHEAPDWSGYYSEEVIRVYYIILYYPQREGVLVGRSPGPGSQNLREPGSSASAPGHRAAQSRGTAPLLRVTELLRAEEQRLRSGSQSRSEPRNSASAPGHRAVQSRGTAPLLRVTEPFRAEEQRLCSGSQSRSQPRSSASAPGHRAAHSRGAAPLLRVTEP